MFPRSLQSDSHSGAREECSALEPLLTAYFDGEAAAAEKQIARAHLSHCAACALAWHRWQSTRALLQGAPAAIPPPSLPARLHVACSLASKAARAAAPQNARDELLLEETLFEAARGLEPEPFVPALRAFFEEAAPPADLQRRILQSTVEATARRAHHSPPKAVPSARGLGDAWRDWLVPLRWAGAATVPALAAWMLLMVRAPQTATHLPDTSTPPVVARVAQTPPAPVRAIRPAKPVAPPTASRPTVAPPAPRVTTVSGRPASTSVSPPQRARDWGEVPQIETPDINPRPVPSVVAPPVEAGIIPQGKEAIRTVTTWIKHQTPRITMVSLTKRSERADVASGPGSIHSTARFSPLPTAPEAPVRPVRIAATFQEALADFGSLRSYGIAELNGVVDDYRAALSSDPGNDDADAPANNDDDDAM